MKIIGLLLSLYLVGLALIPVPMVMGLSVVILFAFLITLVVWVSDIMDDMRYTDTYRTRTHKEG